MAMLNNQRVTLYIYIHMHTHTHYLYVYSRSIKQMMLKLKWWMTRVSVKALLRSSFSADEELSMEQPAKLEEPTQALTDSWVSVINYPLVVNIFIHHPLLSVVPPCWQKNPDLLGITWLCYHFGCVNHEYSQNKPFSIQPLIIPRLGTAKNTPLKNNKSYPLVMSK